MQALRVSLRIARFLGKVLLGLLLILVSAIAIIHLPPVQKQITRAVSNYLSAKIEAKVYIERIDFSILGHVILEDLTVWNRDGIKIFSIGKIELTSSIFDLVTGDLIFDDIRIVGLEGRLTQDEDGLNIQFILDAFQSTEPKSTTEPKAIKLQFKNVQLENIDFEFVSTQNGITVANVVGVLTIRDAEFSTQPTAIKAGKVSLQHSAVNILSTPHLEVTDNINSLINDSIDTDSGISINVTSVEVNDSDFSFHQNDVTNTPKFDPSHIALQDIYVSLKDILVGVHKDTVAAILQSLSVQLPGFKLDDAHATLQWSPNGLVATGLHVTSNSNELHADFSGSYSSRSSKRIDQGQAEIKVSGQINPQDLSYFFNDSVIQYFSHWQSTALTLEGHYILGTGEIKTLNLKTGNSQLQASGKTGDVLDLEKLYWDDLAVNATIGSDFKRTLTPFLRNVNTPSNVSLQLKSSGNLKKALIDGKVFTNWGNVKLNGLAGQQADNVEVDMKVTGEQVELGKWMNVSWIGPMGFSLGANGMVGHDTNVEINGLISDMKMLDQSIHIINVQSRVEKTNATVSLQLDDPKYKSEIQSEISFAGPVALTTAIKFDDFKVGGLLNLDSTLSISGDVKTKLILDQSSMEGYVESDSILFQNHFMKYSLDTLSFHAMLSPTGSDFDYYSDEEKAKLTSNFDIRNSSDVIQTRLTQILKGRKNRIHSTGNRTLHFSAELKHAKLFQLLGIHVDDLSSLRIAGELDEQEQTSILQATSGKFKGYGISLDTLHANFLALPDTVSTSMNVENLFYNAFELGDLNFKLMTQGDTALANLSLANDSITILGFGARILASDSGVFVYPDKLQALDLDYSLDPKNAAFLKENNVRLNNFQISRENMQMTMDGDLNAFDVTLRNVGLTPLNFLLSDSAVIDKGILNGHISYSSRGQQLNLKAKIDSLSLYHSNLLTLDATAVSEGNQVPFELLLTNTTNKINLKGQYNLENTEVDAALLLDVTNPEIFTFLVSGVVDEMKGTVKGETKITGPIQKPNLQGHVQFHDLELTTVNPRFTFNIQDDSVTLDNSSLLFNHFTLYDQQHHPLTVDGNVSTQDYQSFSYDLQINADQYTLMNRPDSARGRLNGVLVIDSDIKLKGNEKDTNVEAKVTIKDDTHLTFVNSSDDVELLRAEGIVDFIDPTLLLDSATLKQTGTYYDSLIASLPDFNLNSTVTIEDDASIRIIIDEQSGDYMETSGGAALELGYDRSGNLRLAGNYTIKEGVYRLSFYNLVKKNFTLVPGSSIHWSGSPENGDLNIKAVHTVPSNSLGLIGHEIGDNEKSAYKRSLDYEVGININGTFEKPIISFSLDLPQEEKTNYPVLANKLDRLRQPEFESELNKQVFGLLVLGGFLPETSGSDINSNTIATTALSNSVNSLLAGQLNRFASQYIKGVNIDVGIQSYSDYSSPGGKTQTAMDFRVSKRIMDDRLSFEIGGDFDINQDQSGANTGNKNYRGDIAIIYDLTGNGDKQLKLFNNETYDIIYQEIRNTGISIIFVREFASNEKKKKEKQRDQE